MRLHHFLPNTPNSIYQAMILMGSYAFFNEFFPKWSEKWLNKSGAEQLFTALLELHPTAFFFENLSLMAEAYGQGHIRSNLARDFSLEPLKKVAERIRQLPYLENKSLASATALILFARAFLLFKDSYKAGHQLKENWATLLGDVSDTPKFNSILTYLKRLGFNLIKTAFSLSTLLVKFQYRWSGLGKVPVLPGQYQFPLQLKFNSTAELLFFSWHAAVQLKTISEGFYQGLVAAHQLLNLVVEAKLVDLPVLLKALEQDRLSKEEKCRLIQQLAIHVTDRGIEQHGTLVVKVLISCLDRVKEIEPDVRQAAAEALIQWVAYLKEDDIPMLMTSLFASDDQERIMVRIAVIRALKGINIVGSPEQGLLNKVLKILHDLKKIEVIDDDPTAVGEEAVITLNFLTKGSTVTVAHDLVNHGTHMSKSLSLLKRLGEVSSGVLSVVGALESLQEVGNSQNFLRAYAAVQRSGTQLINQAKALSKPVTNRM